MNMNSTLPPDLTPEAFCRLADGLTDIIRALRGDAATGYGVGVGVSVPIEQDYGYSKAIRQYEQSLHSIAHFPTTSRLLPTAHQKTTRGGDQLIVDFIYQLLQELSNVCASCQLSPRPMSIAGYATHYNTRMGDAPWRALISRDLADIVEIWHRGVTIDASNVYSPEVHTLGGRDVGGEVLTASVVDAERFAGVWPQAIVTDYVGTPGTVVVTGAARSRTGGVIPEGRAWTATVEGDGTFDMVPDTDGDLLLAVRSIGLPSGMTAGGVLVRGALPPRLR